MKTMLIARIRHLILGPGRRHKTKRPEPARVTPEQYRLLFSCQRGQGRYYPEKNGVSKEVRHW